MDRKKIISTLESVLESKGKRKFKQSVEAVFNFRGIDTTKPENRVNLDIILPKGRGKEVPVIVFADTGMALDAKNAGAAQVYDKAGIDGLAQNKDSLKKMASNSEFLAAPQFMIDVGKNLGQVLGSRGRLPKPVVGSVELAIKQAKARVRVMMRGKYLPTVSCPIGTEDMSVAELADNFEAVYERIREKVGEPSISSAYVKLTMSPAKKVE
ncbi:MAG: hypothetical protein V1822_01750 [Candidatus Micrarchaeota archaeon]